MNPVTLIEAFIAYYGVRKLKDTCTWEPWGLPVILINKGTLSLLPETGYPEDSSQTVYLLQKKVTFCCHPVSDPSTNVNEAEVFFLILKPQALMSLTADDSLLCQDYSRRSPDFWLKLQQELQQFFSISLPLHPPVDFFSDCDHQFWTGIPLSSALSMADALLRILKLLAGTDACDPLISSPVTAGSFHLYQEIQHYLNQSCYKTAGLPDREVFRLSLSQTASHFHITPQYLGKLIRQNTNMTFLQYCNYLKQQRDSQIQKYSRVTPCPGVPIVNTFPVPLSEPASPLCTEDSREVLSVNLNFSNICPDSWKKLINLGYAADLQNLQLEDTLRQVQDKIGFSYGRICRILDLVMSFQIEKRRILDYSQAFSLLDLLIANHMTPFLELGNKIFTIQETNTRSFEPENVTDSKSYYQKLFTLLPDFLRTCINHYGQEEVDSWRFEVSYMYTSTDSDHFSFVQYLQAFQRIKEIILSYSSKCQIGGPGYNRWDHPDQIYRTLKLMKSYHAMPDFLTVYSYPIDWVSDSSRSISKDPDTGMKRLALFMKAVNQTCPQIPVWVSEFNSNLSSRNYINDSEYQATALAKTLITALNSGVQAMGYYLLSDAHLRYSDSMQFLFGGWGLYTDSGLPKASCHCYNLLSLLGRYLVKSGENFLITANSRSSFQLLFNQYLHLKDPFLSSNATPLDLMHPELVFYEKNPREYQLLLRGATAGTYIIREYTIDQQHSNLFWNWQSAHTLSTPPGWLIRDFLQLSSLTPRIFLQELAPNEDFVFSILLSQPEVRFYSVELYASNTASEPDSEKGVFYE